MEPNGVAGCVGPGGSLATDCVSGSVAFSAASDERLGPPRGVGDSERQCGSATGTPPTEREGAEADDRGHDLRLM